MICQVCIVCLSTHVLLFTSIMFTPKFSLTQDAEFVYIHIHAPFIKLSETECYVEEDEFRFYSQPYYLRLHFPGKIQEDQKSSSHYDVDSSQLTVRLAKETKSEHFEGLNLLTELLTPKKTIQSNLNIEVVSKDQADDSVEEESWFIEQNVYEEDLTLVNGPSYGFASRKYNCLNHIVSEITDMIDLPNPDHTSQTERKKLREHQENNLFNCEHYLADFFDDAVIQALIEPDYKELTGTIGEEVFFTDKENEKLLQLPRREYIIDEKNLDATYLGLVDLMFAYAYNFRFTHGENGIESDWTICKLSSTLSWLDSFQSIEDVVICFARRSLIFPLYRNWNIFEKVFSDVKTIFHVGKPQILKCLLCIHSVLSKSEVKYPLNDIYITDYCVWIQSSDRDKIQTIAVALDNVIVKKSDLGFNLVEMEADAKKFMAEDNDEETGEDTFSGLMKAFDKVVTLKTNDTLDSDDCSSGSEEESEESSSEDSSDNSNNSPKETVA